MPAARAPTNEESEMYLAMRELQETIYSGPYYLTEPKKASSMWEQQPWTIFLISDRQNTETEDVKPLGIEYSLSLLLRALFATDS